MGIRAVNLHTTKTVTHVDDVDDPTSFEIGAVDSRVMGHLKDKVTKIKFSAHGIQDDPDAEAGVVVNQNEMNFLLVQFGLKGFTNFQNDKGDVTPQTEVIAIAGRRYDVMHSAIVGSLPEYVIGWLADEITALNEVAPREGK